MARSSIQRLSSWQKGGARKPSTMATPSTMVWFWWISQVSKFFKEIHSTSAEASRSLVSSSRRFRAAGAETQEPSFHRYVAKAVCIEFSVMIMIHLSGLRSKRENTTGMASDLHVASSRVCTSSYKLKTSIIRSMMVSDFCHGMIVPVVNPVVIRDCSNDTYIEHCHFIFSQTGLVQAVMFPNPTGRQCVRILLWRGLEMYTRGRVGSETMSFAFSLFFLQIQTVEE